ncbi:unnamed protein product [Vitrella brassicaformis CCMP3155]|uniref:Peptidase S74 domain-containing protein n=1 Tax=Vitrella brassicaformis (strain CCMP3155) TaxID=1169540 RepID=A0A0G4ETC1_VITBC|nr:unnamed protein product [Vitrella brassicaformis CCMP3155]|eukprot:CEM01693.1 unnamed protein product [Vitrella brassicaformis CCMP3155]
MTLSLGVFVAVLAITFSGVHSAPAQIIDKDLQVEGSIQSLKADSIGEYCHSGHSIKSGDICARDDLMAADNCLVENGLYAGHVFAEKRCTCGDTTHSRSMVAGTYHIETSESADMSAQDAGQRSAAIELIKRLEIKSAGRVLGLSAADVKQVAPNMVSSIEVASGEAESEGEPDERPAVDMTQLLYTQLSVIQELIKKVEALEEAATRSRGLRAP